MSKPADSEYKPTSISFISRSVVYIILAIFVVFGYAFLVGGISILIFGNFTFNSPLLNGGVVVVIVVLLFPIRQRLMQRIDFLFLRGEKLFQDQLQLFTADLAHVVGIHGIIKLVRQYLEKLFFPERLHIFIYDPLNDQYVSTPDETGSLTCDVRIAADSNIVKFLSDKKNNLLEIFESKIPNALILEINRIKIIGDGLYIPLRGQERLGGWVVLGIRKDGEGYSSREEEFIQSLCAQAALAIERSQVVANMEDRVREMNVLARVAQGINITVSLNDILELIYAQTTQIISADDFYILWMDVEKKALVDIFHIENNDRLTDFENKPIAPGSRLELEVARQRKPILTAYFQRECQYYGIVSQRQDLFAWMGVPLNAGAETVGTLSLGKRDPAVSYTSEQLNLLKAIADQAAGAIVKSRLLQESQRRTRQLGVLNEVSRQLTSTLELEPLLRKILKSATELLDCEAGSLLQVDENTDELVFKVVEGPVAADLINRRLPAGYGLVGKSVREKIPIIVNDVQADPDWFSKTDQQTGFVTKALMVVPLEFQGRIFGVLEVINKRDGSLFTQDDEDLLTAFAAQAVIAIQNARLYTMTDQALAYRVEELSVLQRIGRELNTTLETERAMQISLEWAIRHSGATAGFGGLLHETGLNILVSQGYMEELAEFKEADIPFSRISMEKVNETGLPTWIPSNEGNIQGFREGTIGQILVPLRRERFTTAILVLEFDSMLKDLPETINFLARLSDQASIAVSNAQLYAEVKAANIAKSEFVSFVSHELKNPMTSIKGYSELLAAGAVGPINEAQANFLTTIRSNVERMATLVTDLADVSRIEAGRLKLDFKVHNAREIVDELLRSMRRQLEEKKQEVILDFPQDLPAIWADRTRLSQVLTNLVSNANKYGNVGGKITVGAAETDNLWDPDGMARVVHFWVADEGIGISEEDQKKIFQKFFRSEDPKTREAPGTGLGLNITRSLVEHQGGVIWFDSEFRKGTTFHFTIPIAEETTPSG